MGGEAAHHYTVRYLGMLHPRARLEVFRAAHRVLPGFSKADASGPYAAELFQEALLEAVTAAPAAELVALVQTLTGADESAATQ